METCRSGYIVDPLLNRGSQFKLLFVTYSRIKKILFWAIYPIVVVAIALIVLNFAARSLGLGDPILYYNATVGGMRPLPGQTSTRIEGATVTIDENGFRSATVPDKPALKILYLGDSVTWGGSSIDDTELFSEISSDAVRETGSAVYAMNAGVNGSSLRNQSELFDLYHDSVDAVVWIFPWSDAVRAYKTVGYLYPARFKPEFALVEAVDHAIRVFWMTAFRENTGTPDDFSRPDMPYGYETFLANEFERRIDQNLAALRQSLEQAFEDDLPIIVGLTPYVNDGEVQSPHDEALYLLAALEDLGVQTLDLNSILSVQDSESVFVDHIHYSSVGHRLVGTAIGRSLKQWFPVRQ
jgi:lysophospholipase L1-like esterase